MEGVASAQRMTAEEFLALEPHERWRELIDGEVVVNEPSWMHNRSQHRISFALEAWIRGGSTRGAVALPLDVALDERNVYAPDLLWYRDGRVPQLTDLSPYPIPDLAVETLAFDLALRRRRQEGQLRAPRGRGALARRHRREGRARLPPLDGRGARFRRQRGARP